MEWKTCIQTIHKQKLFPMKKIVHGLKTTTLESRARLTNSKILCQGIGILTQMYNCNPYILCSECKADKKLHTVLIAVTNFFKNI